jgi:hypothetical protein
MKKKEIKLRTRLVAAFGIMILLSSFIGAIGILGMRAMATADKRLYANYTIPLMNLERIAEGFQRIRVSLYKIKTIKDQPGLEAETKGIASLLGVVEENVAQYDASILTPEGRKLFVAFDTPFAAFKTGTASLTALAASSEELASTAEELSAQAERLSEIVSYFKTRVSGERALGRSG